jgi:hypothetical protein
MPNMALNIPQLMKSSRAVYSTVVATLKFLHAVLRGEVFERAETIDLMQECWIRFGIPQRMKI